MHSRNLLLFFVVGVLTGAPLQGQEIKTETTRPEFKIEVFDDSFKQLIDPASKIQVVAEGFKWSEGPLDDKPNKRLLFSDVPNNKIWQIRKNNGLPTLSVFLDPSGYDGESAAQEPGSNGLALDDEGRLVVCDHGNRRVYRVESDGTKTTLAEKFEGKRFNSPNDLVIKSNGDIFFTDPPYGLNDQSKRELDFFGVYCLKPDGEISLVTKELVRPNGVTLSPDEKTLYVAQSHKPSPVYMKYAIHDDGTFGKGELLFDAKELSNNAPGMPDGIKVDVFGNLWATGPGGVLVISPAGKLLGRVYTGTPTANCAFVQGGSNLMMTAGSSIAIVPTKTKGVGDWDGDSKSTLLPRSIVAEVSAVMQSIQEKLDSESYADVIELTISEEPLEKLKAEGKFQEIVDGFGDRSAKRLQDSLSNASFSLANYSEKRNKVSFIRHRMDEERGHVNGTDITFEKANGKWTVRWYPLKGSE